MLNETTRGLYNAYVRANATGKRRPVKLTTGEKYMLPGWPETETQQGIVECAKLAGPGEGVVAYSGPTIEGIEGVERGANKGGFTGEKGRRKDKEGQRRTKNGGRLSFFILGSSSFLRPFSCFAFMSSAPG